MKKLLALVIILSSSNIFARDLDSLYKKTELKIGKQKITAYLADNYERREQGLMYIDKIPENVGMLFIFEEERPQGFWMKNTMIPLSIGFFDAKGVLIDVQEMSVAIMEAAPPAYQSAGPALFALEMKKGWFKKHGIKIGSHLERVAPAASPLLDRELPLRKSTRH